MSATGREHGFVIKGCVIIERGKFTARFLFGNDEPETATDADVRVALADGSGFYATFFTLDAIQKVMNRYAVTGESASGTYFWSTDLVIIPQPGITTMIAVIEELVRTGEFTSACQSIPSSQARLTEEQLYAIDDRARRATPGPWEARLETRHGIGGSSCIDLSPGQNEDNELYVAYSPVSRHSPNVALDADLDFIAHARSDVPRLVAEIRELQGLTHHEDHPTP